MTTNYATCSACAERVPCNSQHIYPDNGWVLPFDTFGYYGGFDDNVQVLTGSTMPREWILCHECVVKFFETFPRLAESLGANCHPCEDDEPCCQFAWQATPLFATRTSGVHTRSAYPDGKWHDGVVYGKENTV